jgi:EAL domain-containing protein (putative c-di-GMP-specific phosphodiesterase class I)
VLNRYGVSETAAAGTAAGPAISVGDLLTGLESNQFVAYFQPKVDANSLEVIGVEVLARWNHPQHGILSPGLFVPLAENGGLIEILTMAIFKSAIDAGSQLHRLGYQLKIAVNYSAQSFGSLELPEFIVATSQAAGLDPRYLIIEVTESGLVHDPTVALDVLSRLRLKGVSLSIDDFGTGYSSMEQLRRIPFSELKIDQGFVRGAGQDATARSILESSIAMAKKLNLTTVAEGVETQEDLEVVRSLGCDLVQGYLIAKPMALADLIVWLQRKR